MEKVIKELTERRDKLKADYYKFVINGSVDYNSPAAVQNREYYEQYDKAIKILTTFVDMSKDN